MGFLGIFGLTFWAVWCIRKLLGIGYKPHSQNFFTTTSIIVPVYDEKPWIVDRCITSIEANHPSEIIVVFNGLGNSSTERLERKHPQVSFLHQKLADKRHAMALGVKEAKGEVVVFVDSDVTWEISTLSELIRPFSDPQVGGVCSNQIIDNAQASIWTTLGSWLTEMGLIVGMPFQSVKKCVSCLRGRTAAYRRELVLSFLDDFQDEYFLGRRCKSGDDGRLTFLTLRAGYGTVYQSTAIVHTFLPEKMGKFLNHRIRCNRNTFRRYFSSIGQRWFWKQNWRFLLELLASIVIPLCFVNCVAHFLLSLWHQEWPYLLLMFSWFCLGRSIRGFTWIKRNPSRILRIPAMVLCFLFLLTTVRWYALLTMNEQGWLTRGKSEERKLEIKRHPIAVTASVALTSILLLACFVLNPTNGRNFAPVPPVFATQTSVSAMPSVVKTVTKTTMEPVQEERSYSQTVVPSSTPTPLQQPTIGNKLLVGVFLPNFPPERNLDAFETQTGTMDIIAWFQNWNHDPVTKKLEITCLKGKIPLITWESWSGRAQGAHPYPLSEIAEGKYDQLIKSHLQLIGQTCSGVVLVRFDHEMNTPPGEVSWYPWQGDPASYIAAWKRVVTIGREVTPNIKWVWAPAWGNEDAALYWPGDEYVDYVGLTVLNFWRKELDLRLNWWRWRSFAQLYEPQREYLLQFGKPIIITEVATGEGPNQNDKPDWITAMFQKIRNEYSEVAAVVWFNADHAREFPDIIWRLDSSPESLEAFRTAIRTKQLNK